MLWQNGVINGAKKTHRDRRKHTYLTGLDIFAGIL